MVSPLAVEPEAAPPGARRPAFDAMLEEAIRLCNAVSGHFRVYDGNGFPLAAVRGDYAAFYSAGCRFESCRDRHSFFTSMIPIAYIHVV